MPHLVPERLLVRVCRTFHPYLPLALFPWHGPFVLVYHDVADEPGPFLDQQAVCIAQRDFEAQIAFLARNYHLIRFSELRAHRADPLAVAVTLDDGFRSNLTRVLPIIERHACPIKIFLTSCNVLGELNWMCKLNYLWHELDDADMQTLAGRALRPAANGGRVSSLNDFVTRFAAGRTSAAIDELFAARGSAPREPIYLAPEEVRRLAEHPLVELGSHSRNHYPLSALPDDQVRDEIVLGHEELRSAFGSAIVDHALPFGRREDMSESAAAALDSIGSPFISAYGGRCDERQALGRQEIRRRAARGNVGVLYGRLRSIPRAD